MKVTGLCNTDGKYSGTVSTGGNIMLAGTLVTSVPLLGDKTFQIPAVMMPLPKLMQQQRGRLPAGDHPDRVRDQVGVLST